MCHESSVCCQFVLRKVRLSSRPFSVCANQSSIELCPTFEFRRCVPRRSRIAVRFQLSRAFLSASPVCVCIVRWYQSVSVSKSVRYVLRPRSRAFPQEQECNGVEERSKTRSSRPGNASGDEVIQRTLRSSILRIRLASASNGQRLCVNGFTLPVLRCENPILDALANLRRPVRP